MSDYKDFEWAEERSGWSWLWIVAVATGLTCAMLLLAGAAWQIGYMDGRADLDEWFKTQNVMRFHCPDPPRTFTEYYCRSNPGHPECRQP